MKTIKAFSHFFSKRQEKRSRKSIQLLGLLLISFIIALLSHLFFLMEWFDGRYMTGMNDGLSQMLPFKQLLYDSYTSGSFSIQISLEWVEEHIPNWVTISRLQFFSL